MIFSEEGGSSDECVYKSAESNCRFKNVTNAAEVFYFSI